MKILRKAGKISRIDLASAVSFADAVDIATLEVPVRMKILQTAYELTSIALDYNLACEAHACICQIMEDRTAPLGTACKSRQGSSQLHYHSVTRLPAKEFTEGYPLGSRDALVPANRCAGATAAFSVSNPVDPCTIRFAVFLYVSSATFRGQEHASTF